MVALSKVVALRSFQVRVSTDGRALRHAPAQATLSPKYELAQLIPPFRSLISSSNSKGRRRSDRYSIRFVSAVTVTPAAILCHFVLVTTLVTGDNSPPYIHVVTRDA